ncbi:MAG: aminopeptidase [Lachnospiraceae bacterium]|jgi:aspartyl aminopeptidase|nr:aminopeptidase [Lachnospiraceae bacterium]
MEKTKGQLLEEELSWKPGHIGIKKKEWVPEAAQFCEPYKAFLDAAKTERECVAQAVKVLEAAGYHPYDPKATYKTGDAVYEVERGKALIAAKFGARPLEEGVRLNIAHVDSPRLDLKPSPLFEKNEVAYLKTHYYGGIRKYQWATIPLALHGVVVLKDGRTLELSLGEKAGDPVFCITDLLPHLSAEQNKRTLAEGIKGEELNIVVGSLPYDDEKIKEPVKLAILALLHDEYGFAETDFARAEIEMVPAVKAADVGLDRSLVGAYGQDDRVCAYTALMAQAHSADPTYTAITVLADKEEIGSEGNTGINSAYLRTFLEGLAKAHGADAREMFRNSSCLSSDVNAAFDPTFHTVFEAGNSCYLNKGCVLTKYTGARGKSGSNDASAEYMAKVIDIMEAEGVFWQIGELGAVDVGGGGTVAKFVASLDIDTVDLGVPILSMHSPFELASKLDIYDTYRAFMAFFK